MDQELRDKFIAAVVKKIEAQNGDSSNIDILLKNRQIAAEDRKLIIEIAEAQVAARRRFAASSRKSSISNFHYHSPNGQHHHRDHASGENDATANQTSDPTEILSKSYIAGLRPAETMSSWALTKQSFVDLFKNILPILLFGLIGLLIFAIFYFTYPIFSSSHLMLGMGGFIWFLFAVFFTASFAKFLSERDFLLSLKYAGRNIIHIAITTAGVLNSFLVITLIIFVAAYFIGGTAGAILGLLTWVIVISGLYNYYYFYFAIMINDEKFYLSAIEESCLLIKGRFWSLMIKTGIFMTIIMIFQLIAGLIVPNAISNAFAIVWSFVFYQIIYEDFAATRIVNEVKISKIPQIIFISSLVFLIVELAAITLLLFFSDLVTAKVAQAKSLINPDILNLLNMLENSKTGL